MPERSVRRVAPLRAAGGDDWPAALAAPGRGYCRRPSRSRPWRCCRTIRRSVSPGAASRRRVKRADGPERVFGEWWKRDAETVAVRDYFQVEDDAGERFWIFRAGDGEDAATGDLSVGTCTGSSR